MSPRCGHFSVSGSSNATGQERQHRAHRHKKFHVRREALGKDYEAFDVSLPPDATPAPKPDVSPPAEPAGLSEEEVKRLVAKRMLGTYVAGLILLLLLAFLFWPGSRLLVWHPHIKP